MCKLQQLLACVASLTFVMTGSVARAEFNLCSNEGQPAEESPSTQWGAYCAGNGVVYADIQVAPHVAWPDQIGIHVTDHGDCPGNMRLQCSLDTSLGQDFGCLGEQSPTWPETEGHITWLRVSCGCYAPDEDCHS